MPMIKLTAAIRRQAWLILAVTLLGAALGVLYLQYAPVRYESVAKLLLSSPEIRGVPDFYSGEGNPDRVISEDSLANYIDVLRSRRNVEAALENAGLLNHESIHAEISDTQDAVDYVIKNIEAGRGGKGDSRASRTIEVRFRHSDAETGRQVLESVIEEFVSLLSEQYRESLAAVGTRVEAVRSRTEEELQLIQKEFLEQRRSGPILLAGKGGSAACIEDYQELEKSFRAAEMEKATIDLRLKAASAALESFSDEEEPLPIEALGVIDTDSLRRLGVFSDLKANASRSPGLQIDLPVRTEVARTQYGHLLRLLAEKQRLTADFGDGHPEVKKLDEEILLVQEFLQDRDAADPLVVDDPPFTWRQLLEGYAAFLESEERLIAERVSGLQKRVVQAEQQVRRVMDFQLRDEMLRKRLDRENLVLEEVTEKIRNLNLAHGADMKLHEVLESPRAGIRIWPLPAICCSAGVVLGLMSGVFLGLVNDQLCPGFRNGAELEDRVGVPVIGYVPKLPFWHATGVVPRKKRQSEAFRVLRTVLLNEVRAGRLKTMTASSPLKNDGKTTVLLNLAASFADLGMSVVFVEADMRHPGARKRLKLKGRMGLSDILEAKCTVDQALCTEDRFGFSVIHAGGSTMRPSELLESQAFETLIADLRARFTLVIVDVGPVLSVCDALVVSAKMDGTLLVVRPSIDSRSDILGAVEALQASGIPLLGAVVNTSGSSGRFESGRFRNGPF